MRRSVPQGRQGDRRRGRYLPTGSAQPPCIQCDTRARQELVRDYPDPRTEHDESQRQSSLVCVCHWLVNEFGGRINAARPSPESLALPMPVVHIVIEINGLASLIIAGPWAVRY